MSSVGIRIPDRFEAMMRMANIQDLRTLVEEVPEGLALIQDLYEESECAGRGALLILLGAPGSGKSTFLSTVHLFRQGVSTVAIEPREAIPKALETLAPFPGRLRIVLIKDRESLARTSEPEVVEALSAINHFLRSDAGLNTIIAWPCNRQDLMELLVARAREIGGTALLGPRSAARFSGPPHQQYLPIARRTIAALNEGATLLDLGITEERAEVLASAADTIGAYLLSLSEEARRNRSALMRKLPVQERYRLITVVVAANGAEGDCDALTRGASFTADIDRLLASTEANIVRGLRAQPEKLGVLATLFDARIVHVQPATAMAVVRDFADDTLRGRLESAGFPAAPDGSGAERLAESRLVLALRGERVGLKQAGRKPGERTLDRFEKLTEFSGKDDAALNRTLGRALEALGVIRGFEAEKPLSVKEQRSGDLLCQTDTGPVLLEFMWRRRTSRGEIAKYVLTKLAHYGRNLGFLD